MFTEKEYFVKADNLLRGSEFILHSLFYLRWKESQGNDWSMEQLDRLKKGPGKAVFASASIAEKVQLETGNIEGWDLPLLVRILVEVLSTCTGDGDKIKQEQDSLQKIVQMKEKLANNREKKIGAQTYMKIEDGARSALLRLGDTTEVLVNKLIGSAGVISADDVKEQSQIKLKEGDRQMQTGNFQEALKLYNEALMLPGLLLIHQTPVLEKRAKCYLLMAKRAGANVDLVMKAERDMNAILEYIPTDLKALQFRGIVLMARKKFDEAFIKLTRALTLCPEHEQARENLDMCQIRSGRIPKDLRLPKIPTSLEERIKRFDRTLENPKFREVCLTFYGKIVKELLPFQECVTKGHDYSEGRGVDQSCLEAAKWYMDAAEKCNPEGMLYLASLYLQGDGIKKDVPMAKRLLEAAAKLPVEMYGAISGDGIKIITGFTKFGVQYAQLYLGILHHAGTLLSPNDIEAVKWFKKAASNGSDIAAFHLGCMYWEGEGIQRNARLAELYWTFAVRLDDNKDAAYALSRYYFSEMEYSLAELMLNKAIDFGYTALLQIKDDTVKMFRKQAQERVLLEEELVKFEKKAKLPISRMTFRDRMERKTHFGKSAGTHQVCPGETSKTFLKDPARIYIRKFHRLGLKENIGKVPPVSMFSRLNKADRTPRQTAPFSDGLFILKCIGLEEIDPSKSMEYPRALHLTVIENPCVVVGALQVVAEDSNKTTIMLHVENVDPTQVQDAVLGSVGFGCRIAVLHPYNKINIDMLNTLQVAHPSYIISTGKIDNMCRYCGEKDAKLNCGKCKWARYCSKECQQGDWKKLNHKSICVPR